ncbi:unnamed protein product [Adineta steineri]|uniref:Transmembrane protein n=1 Tax=Adineta steineri TaxID=433720 RepID=A0A818GIL9_9BILA|nr:unnamed protein product [Adineta steineri]CAF1246982.1 unnamed protein product [Adineta steineri]CAF3489677.1 unnamed protein product [Adineta steineri]CAF3606420.1 unnamed protein product [Adineta steineri]
MTEFEKKRMICFDAINRQISHFQEPQHPIWQIILSKQCCGLDSNFSQRTIEEYQWFTHIPFSYFCSHLYLKQDEIIRFEHTFKIKYSPQGFCLPLINKDLKIELILITIDFGFGIFLMLLTWLFIWQEKFSYLKFLKKRLQKQKMNSIENINKPSITSTIQESEVSEKIDKSDQIHTIKSFKTKQLYKGYISALDDVE